MNKTEIAKLLTIASGFDRRVVDPVTIEAWALVPEMVAADFDAAVAAVVAHQTSPKRGEYLTLGHIAEALKIDGRNSLAAIEADVRSAKARGLISRTWPSRDRLPANVADALFTLRDLERRQAAQRFELDQLEGSPADVGTVGRAAP